ncbi:MAG: MFS transporter [Deltaproteobacteria bacterium]|nr:MFS transporter [Deltaproteobacteria bacterium]
MPADENSKDVLIIFSVALATFMGRLDSYIVNVSLPTMARYFDSSLSDISRVVFIYVLAAASTLLLFGKWADRTGLRRFFIWGYILFTGGSLLCGVSASIDMLTISRFVQGLGSSMLAATSLAIISRHIPREKSGRAFGIFTSASALGITLGAPLGGFITDYISWHWIFLINMPIGIAAIVIAGKVIPGKIEQERDIIVPPFDFPGAFLSMAAISLLLFALNNGQEYGWASVGIISGFIFSALCGVAFVVREKRVVSPLIDLSLLGNPRLYCPLVANFIIYMTIAAHNFLIPFYLDLLKHMTPARIGLFLMIYSVVFVIVPPIAGRYSEKTNPVIISTLAMAITAFSFFFFSFTLHLQGLFFVVAFFVVRAIGNGMFVPPNNVLIMKCASEKDEGTISGILNTVTYLGVTIGVVVFETIFSQIIHQSRSDQTLGSPGFVADNLYPGFRYIFVTLGFISIIGMIFSYLTGVDAKRKAKEIFP